MQVRSGKRGDDNLLNAAGTPMIRPFPFSSVARLTLFPGDPSTRSRLGMGSLILTYAGADAVNVLRFVKARGADVMRGMMRCIPRP